MGFYSFIQRERGRYYIYGKIGLDGATSLEDA